MTVAAPRVDLGSGVEACLVWNANVAREGPDAGIPTAVIVRHADCSALYVPWAGADGLYADGEQWSLTSLVPLTMDPAIACPRCGRTGIIENGRWVDLEVDTT